MRRALMTLIALLSLTVHAQTLPPLVHADGTRIVTATGTTVRLRGVNYWNPSVGQPLDLAQLTAIHNAGFNAIRDCKLTHQALGSQIVNQAVAWNVPLVVGEFGGWATGTGSTPTTGPTFAGNAARIIASAGQSWIYWGWGPRWDWQEYNVAEMARPDGVFHGQLVPPTGPYVLVSDFQPALLALLESESASPQEIRQAFRAGYAAHPGDFGGWCFDVEKSTAGDKEPDAWAAWKSDSGKAESESDTAPASEKEMR